MLSLGQVWRLGLNDLRLSTKDRAAFFWMLIMPVGMMWFFGNLGGDPSATPSITLVVEDRDGGFLAQGLLAELQSDQMNITLLEDWEREEPPPRILVIPEGASEKLLGGEKQVLKLELGEDSSESFSFGAQVTLTRALGRFLGSWVEVRSDDPPPEGEALKMRLEELADLPPTIKLEVTTAGKGQVVPSGRAQSVPGILTMVVLMMTLIYGGVFLTLERQEGMLKRQHSLPITRLDLIAGKVIGRFLIASMQIVVLLLIGRFVFRINFGPSLGALILLCFAFGTTVAAMSTLLGAVCRNPEQASTAGWIGSLVLAGLGGCWWPIEVMPAWLQFLGQALPTTWAMTGFHRMISFGQGIEGVWFPSLVLFGFTVVFTLIAARQMVTD